MQMMTLAEKAKSVRSLLERAKPQIAMALPKHMDADRLMRVAMTSVQKTPKLLECDQVSLLGAIIQSAQLGLEPDGVLGEAYLIPFGRQVQFIAGYRGLLKLARQSGQISTIEARVVHAKDHFAYGYGLTPTLDHKPTTEADPGALTHAYCVVRMKDGGVQWDVMTRAEVDAVRKRSRAAESGPWVTDYDAMALKSVARRTLKWCPASTQLARAVALDERAEAGLSQEVDLVLTADALAVEEPEKPKALDALTEKLSGGTGSNDSEGHPETPGSESVPAAATQPTPVSDRTVSLAEIRVQLQRLPNKDARAEVMQAVFAVRTWEDVARLSDDALAGALACDDGAPMSRIEIACVTWREAHAG